MGIKQQIRNWYYERADAMSHERDDEVSDLDEYIIEDLLAWALDDENKRNQR